MTVRDSILHCDACWSLGYSMFECVTGFHSVEHCISVWETVARVLQCAAVTLRETAGQRGAMHDRVMPSGMCGMRCLC